MTEKYFICNMFFDESFIIKDRFFIQQEELALQYVNKNDRTASFEVHNIAYDCQWIQNKSWNSELPAVLIPIKNNKELLSFTLSNLKANDLHLHSNIIVIDDRSQNDLKSITIKNNFSYLRIDNSKGFNFSMLNNIAAKICYDLGIKEIVLWNSDLWCVKKEWFPALLEKHRKHNSTLTGTKLVYPPIKKGFITEENTENIRTTFPSQSNKWRNTVQFGGSSWPPQGPLSCVGIAPSHRGRFHSLESDEVNWEGEETFVTGAFQIINLKEFIKIGGFNPSLAKNFQDVDLCLKLKEQNKKIFYFGKNLYMYHGESISLVKEGKYDDQMTSDHVLFGRLWHKKIYRRLLKEKACISVC